MDAMEEVEELSALEQEEEVVSSPAFEIESRIAAFEPFQHSRFPVLLIDSYLKIHFSNYECKKLFPAFVHSRGRYLTDILGRFFDEEDIREIRETLQNGRHGYSWNGEVKMKSRERATLQAKLYLFPADLSVSKPQEFILIFDDVTEENRLLLRSVFLSLLEASKLKDNDTGRHITRVNYYSMKLARALYNKKGCERIDADFIDNIGFLASMHDVGKIGTPDDILNKEGPLSDWEWTIMKEHTKNGAFILSTYPNPMAKEIALSHHEKWDGEGYPFSLEGEMIPLSARIVSIADVYDALRMERSYKPALDHKTTLEKMEAAKNTQFDPKLFDVFLTISGDFEKIYDENRDTEHFHGKR
jgi:putative two-component system response regulator